MTVLSSAETAEQPPRKKLCLSASRQLQSKSYARSQLNPMASPLDQPGYSFLMFTLPFGAYFSMKYFLSEIVGIQGYQVIAISVIFAVIIVQLIIYCYVKQAFNEPVNKTDESDGYDDNRDIDNSKKDK